MVLLEDIVNLIDKLNVLARFVMPNGISLLIGISCSSILDQTWLNTLNVTLSDLEALHLIDSSSIAKTWDCFPKANDDLYQWDVDSKVSDYTFDTSHPISCRFLLTGLFNRLTMLTISVGSNVNRFLTNHLPHSLKYLALVGTGSNFDHRSATSMENLICLPPYLIRLALNSVRIGDILSAKIIPPSLTWLDVQHSEGATVEHLKDLPSSLKRLVISDFELHFPRHKKLSILTMMKPNPLAAELVPCIGIGHQEVVMHNKHHCNSTHGESELIAQQKEDMQQDDDYDFSIPLLPAFQYIQHPLNLQTELLATVTHKMNWRNFSL